MRRQIRQVAPVILWLTFGATAATAQHQTPDAEINPTHDAVGRADEMAVRSVEMIHGVAGPFAVAGYRMGRRAMDELGLLKGSFTLEVRHRAPAEVQWSCVVDGLQAATGASLGKLNLSLTQIADPKQVQSVVINRQTGERITFTLSDAFLKRFFNVPVPNLSAAGQEAIKLKDEEIFRVEALDKKPSGSPFKRAKAPAATTEKRD